MFNFFVANSEQNNLIKRRRTETKCKNSTMILYLLISEFRGCKQKASFENTQRGSHRYSVKVLHTKFSNLEGVTKDQQINNKSKYALN